MFKVKYVLTEDRNFNTFLKENYAIALDSCCFTKKNVEHGIWHDINST